MSPPKTDKSKDKEDRKRGQSKSPDDPHHPAQHAKIGGSPASGAASQRRHTPTAAVSKNMDIASMLQTSIPRPKGPPDIVARALLITPSPSRSLSASPRPRDHTPTSHAEPAKTVKSIMSKPHFKTSVPHNQQLSSRRTPTPTHNEYPPSPPVVSPPHRSKAPGSDSRGLPHRTSHNPPNSLPLPTRVSTLDHHTAPSHPPPPPNRSSTLNRILNSASPPEPARRAQPIIHHAIDPNDPNHPNYNLYADPPRPGSSAQHARPSNIHNHPVTVRSGQAHGPPVQPTAPYHSNPGQDGAQSSSGVSSSVRPSNQKVTRRDAAQPVTPSGPTMTAS
jgi:hypothetical protein